jgi:hypothetical protein
MRRLSARRRLECAKSLDLAEEQLIAEEEIGKAWMVKGDLVPAAEHFERAWHSQAIRRCGLDFSARRQASRHEWRSPRTRFVREALQVLDPLTQPLDTANALAIEARFHHLPDGTGRRSISSRGQYRSLRRFTGPPRSPVPGRDLGTTFAYPAVRISISGSFDDADRWARRAIEFGEKPGLPPQAAGYEFLGEDAAHTGRWKRGFDSRTVSGRSRTGSIPASAEAGPTICRTCADFQRWEHAEQESIEGCPTRRRSASEGSARSFSPPGCRLCEDEPVRGSPETGRAALNVRKS